MDPTLRGVVDWVIRGGASLVAYWIMKQVAAAFPEARPDVLRYGAYAVAGLVGIAAWGIGIEFGYIEAPPADWHRWVEGAAGVVLVVILGAQTVHAVAELSGRPSRLERELTVRIDAAAGCGPAENAASRGPRV